MSTVFDLSFSYVQKDPFYKSNQLLVITARHHKILEHKFSYNFCSASFFYQKLFIDLFMIMPHAVRTQVKVVVFLSIVAGKMFLLSSLKITVSQDPESLYTNAIISMELLICFYIIFKNDDC